VQSIVLTLVLLGIFVFGVPVKGSWLALISGALIYLAAATAFGLLVSTLTRTQVAAVFATAVIALIPATQFSGLLVPVSSLSGAGRAIAFGFPASIRSIVELDGAGQMLEKLRNGGLRGKAVIGL
jgi:ribosome-dependent ATPase